MRFFLSPTSPPRCSISASVAWFWRGSSPTRAPDNVGGAYALPVIVLLTALVAAGALFLSATQVRFRDVGIAVPLLLYLWLFSTPVGYPLSWVPAAYRSYRFLLNPMTGIVEGFRGAIIHGVGATGAADAGGAGAGGGDSAAVSYLVFKRAEATMADVI